MAKLIEPTVVTAYRLTEHGIHLESNNGALTSFAVHGLVEVNMSAKDEGRTGVYLCMPPHRDREVIFATREEAVRFRDEVLRAFGKEAFGEEL